MAARSVLMLGSLLASLAAPAALAQGSHSPTGLWLTQAGDAKVRVNRCGKAYCGTVVWLRDPIDRATGKPAIDDKNPNPARAGRPMIGLRIFGDMRTSGQSKWSGHIYNADDGQTYISHISLTGPRTLRVEGCVGALCGGENWTRTRR
ncbi:MULTISPECIES: DUF2147 domain-containing protein [Rhodopseudomonas]|uniref:DUF2147 domain-containing protein n=1 Tax=Rhodopseudomonas palustris TaxID=1076 RepID=A0A0D7E0W6_RHOPL|nr:MULTISPECIES: DUF2147 domain-containing protein [Rhodopseudomonas]KIZ34474.1 hypothetical protein OO17_26795 [Rhodopseudomonas palustris]MDF3814355.1 DUF2147 domain-containing protein [Rhodopseudomonas sp. BAL398]WOK18051.1 DUF2147 domain-containing protein [Rhodopseudomonas sp. BAL398]